MNIAMLLTFLLAFASACALLFHAIRGKRIGDHPVCRRCGFDLSGKPSTTILCSECGADLGEYDAVAYGHLHRRQWQVWVGVLMLIFFGGMLASHLITIDLSYAPKFWVIRQASSADGYTRTAALTELNSRIGNLALSTSDWTNVIDHAIAYRSDETKPWETGWGDLMQRARINHHVPDALWTKYVTCLAHQAFSTKPWRRAEADKELNQRILDGLLSTTDIHAVADQVLACQADLTVPWDKSWGNWMEDAHVNRQLTKPQWKQYIEQSWAGAMQVQLRPRVRRGDPLPVFIAVQVCRAGSFSNAKAQVSNMKLQWVGPANAAPVDLKIGDFTLEYGTTEEIFTHCPAAACPPSIADGPQNLRITADIKANPASEIFQDFAVGKLETQSTFTLVPANQSTVTMVPDPALVQSMRDSIRVVPFWESKTSPRQVRLDISVVRPPAGLAFNLLLRADGREIDAGTVACPAATLMRDFTRTIDWPLSSDGPLDVILRSNPTAAAKSVDTVEAWEGELETKDVPVK